MPTNKTLITGAAGFIGFHLAQRLLERGDQVCGLDNLNDYYDVNLKKDRLKLLEEQQNFTFIKTDILLLLIQYIITLITRCRCMLLRKKRTSLWRTHIQVCIIFPQPASGSSPSTVPGVGRIWRIFPFAELRGHIKFKDTKFYLNSNTMCDTSRNIS